MHDATPISSPRPRVTQLQFASLQHCPLTGLAHCVAHRESELPSRLAFSTQVIHLACPRAGVMSGTGVWQPVAAGGCRTRQCHRSNANGTGEEPRVLAKYVVQAERYLGEQGRWAVKCKPMLDALACWGHAGCPPSGQIRNQFAVHMGELVARVAGREAQCSVAGAVSRMQIRVCGWGQENRPWPMGTRHALPIN